MTKYLNGIDISDYYEGQVGRICDYFKNQGTPLSIAQVEITAGTYNDTEIYNTLSVIKDVVNNGLKLGYYAFLYPEKLGDSPIRQQAIAFTNVYTSIKNQYGITPDCKIMIDVEETGFSQIHAQPSTEQVTFMINTFADTVDSILGKQEYVVYSSASFITSYFGEIDTERFGLIVSSTPPGLFDMEQINYPTGNYTPINYNLYPNNWGSNWTGVQFSFGGKQDYDIYKDNILLGDKNPTKIPTKKEAIFYPNEYVKLQKNCSVFAPNKIPSNDKNKSFTISSINKSECGLKGLNQLVFSNELKLIEKKSKIIIPEKPNGTYVAWDSLDFYTKLGLYIGTWEGYEPYETGGTIGYSTTINNNWNGGMMTRSEALTFAIQYIKANESYYRNTMKNYGLNPDELSSNKLFALYDAGYNLRTDAFINLIIGIVSSNGNPDESVFTVHADYSQTKLRRASEWEIYTKDEITFWNSYDALPAQYRSIVVNGIQENKIFSVE